MSVKAGVAMLKSSCNARFDRLLPKLIGSKTLAFNKPCIINSVVSFRREDDGTVVLQDGSKVPVAKKRKEDLVGLFMG